VSSIRHPLKPVVAGPPMWLATAHRALGVFDSTQPQLGRYRYSLITPLCQNDLNFRVADIGY